MVSSTYLGDKKLWNCRKRYDLGEIQAASRNGQKVSHDQAFEVEGHSKA